MSTSPPSHLEIWSRRALLAGLGALLFLAPWETWSIGILWHLGWVVTPIATCALLWSRRTVAWRALNRPLVWGLGVFLLAVFISCFASIDPDTSWRFLRKELLVYLIVLAGIVLGVTARTDLRGLTIALTLSGLIACAMGIAVHYFYLHGADEETRIAWRDDEIVDHDNPADPVTLRAQFPLEHHNKLAFLAALVTLLTVHIGLTGKRARALWCLAAVIPLWALMLTLNRGSLIGLVAAALLVLTLANWRFGVALIVVAALATPFLPSHIRRHQMTIFHAATYQGEWSSLVYRLRGWRGALTMIGDHPLTGIGYSWKNFEEIYEQYAIPEEVQHKPHAHSNVLEIAAEVGVVGALGFVLFQWGLLIASLRAWWSRRRAAHGLATLIALQLVVLIVGLISYYLRERLGLVIWAVLALSLAHLLIAEREAAEAQP